MEELTDGKQLLLVDKESLRQIIEEMLANYEAKPQEKIWVNQTVAMEILGLRSKSSMKRLRDENLVIFSQGMKKVILYKRSSLLEYLERNSNKTY